VGRREVNEAYEILKWLGLVPVALLIYALGNAVTDRLEQGAESWGGCMARGCAIAIVSVLTLVGTFGLLVFVMWKAATSMGG
jgi:hypothetical protein